MPLMPDQSGFIPDPIQPGNKQRQGFIPDQSGFIPDAFSIPTSMAAPIDFSAATQNMKATPIDWGALAKGVAEAGVGGMTTMARGFGNTIGFMGKAIDAASNVGNYITGNTPLRAAQYVTDYSKSGLNKIADTVEQQAVRNSGLDPHSLAGNIGNVMGGAASAIFNTALVSPLMRKIPIPGHNELQMIANTAVTSPVTTTASAIANTGDLPSWETYRNNLLIDLATGQLALIGGRIYRNAFNQSTPQGVQKSLAHNYNKISGQIAEEYGYTGDAESIRKQAEKAMEQLYEEASAAANQGKTYTAQEFYDKVYNKLAEPFLNSGLDTPNREAALKALENLVFEYTPMNGATGAQLMDIISDINTGLYNAGTRMALSPKQLSSASNQLKNAVKDLLPDTIGDYYRDYASNKLISSIMENAEGKKIFARALIGGSTGATIGALGSVVSDPRNWQQALVSAIVGAVGGGYGATKTANVSLQTNLGQALKFPNSTAGQAFWKGAANQAVQNMKTVLDYNDFAKGYREVNPGASEDDIKQQYFNLNQ